MHNNKKFITGIICVLLAIGLLVGSFIFVDWYKNRPVFTDKNGWVHNVEGTEYESDPYASLDYIVIDSNKEEFANMTAHQFLSKINPIFKAYSGKTYVTFDFGDGTGLYWPYADKKNDGIYGTIDETGHIISQESYVHIEGKTITKIETSVETSKSSVNMYELLPEAYYADNTMVAVMDDVLYVNVYFDASSREYADIANELWNIYKKADLSGIKTVLIRMNNDVFYEVNTMVADSAPVYIENGYAKWSGFLYGEEAENDDIIDATEYDPEKDSSIDINVPSKLDANTEETEPSVEE